MSDLNLFVPVFTSVMGAGCALLALCILAVVLGFDFRSSKEGGDE